MKFDRSDKINTLADFPSVVSGDALLLLDPNKQDDKACTRHLLSKNKRTVQSMKRTFGRALGNTIFDADAKDGFHGTVFRFPLRRAPSKLSRGLYNDEKVSQLLESFRTEMMLILVFLRSLESVEILRSKAACSDSLEPSFSAYLTDESAKERRDRKSDLEKDVFIAKSGYKRISYVSCKVTDHLSTLSFSLSWTVASLCLDRTEIPLSFDPIIEFPPFVGVAVADVSKTSREIMMTMGLVANALRGHVFCFLPLPLQNQSITGLPVQINGFFALSANRHHLKWPSSDEELYCWKTQGDDSSRWNKILLTVAIPRAYRDLITTLIETSKAKGNTEESLRAVYDAFPTDMSENSMWKTVVAESYKLILKTACFFSAQNGGMWVTVGEKVVFVKDENSSDFHVEIREILNRLGITVSCIPAGVYDTAQGFADGLMSLLTPAFVRDLLKGTRSYHRESPSAKLRLLDFIIKDIHTEQNISQLYGIGLLPLSDRSFELFQNDVSHKGQQNICVLVTLPKSLITRYFQDGGHVT